VSQESTNRSFDDLARGLANGSVSRRRALRVMGAALVGGALASIPGIARAKPKPAGRKCSHNHQCESGQCVDRVCQGGTCPRPPLTEGECNCASRCGDTVSSPFVCQNNPNCFCVETTEGTGFCSDITASCESIPPCSSSSDCPSGWTCQVNSCCETPVCGPPCTCAKNGSICTDGFECCSGFCSSGTCATPDCQNDSDCDDSNECTADVCLDGMCVHTPIEEPPCGPG
jgi:hypothetical protein